MSQVASPSAFLSEAQAYALMEHPGLRPPHWAWLDELLAGKALFAPGESIVLKGLGDELWHKSEIGAVRFMAFDLDAIRTETEGMRKRVEAAGHAWLGAVVCERIPIAKSDGLPTEAFAALSRGEGGWTLVLGFGGLQAEALAKLAPALRWPLAFTTPDAALEELKNHLLGQSWLGTLRGARPLTDERKLHRFLEALWALADRAEAEGLDLLELNPVALHPSGEPRALDGVGRRAAAAPRRLPPPPFLDAILAPERVALMGVSSQEGNVGRIILGNLRLAPWDPDDLLLVKPGHDSFLGLPCIPDLTVLKDDPVDLLVIALPAAAAAAGLRQLLEQGGGAKVVALVAGGLGDGADHEGLGAALKADVEAARAAGRWTPAILGPNFLGHWAPGRELNTSFIPKDKLPLPPRPGGPLALLSQSGAFLISRLSRNPDLPMGLGLALGNQMDLRLSDVLDALLAHPEFRAVGAYVEGFPAGDLGATARAASRLKAEGRTVLLYRAGRSEAGQAAAASHTGAIAGDRALEEALLRRAGVRLAPTMAAFDAGLAWLGAFPDLRPGPVALLTNAGFESVAAADLLEAPFPPARLSEPEVARLQALLDARGLGALVAPRLPLDLTPMASEPAFLEALELVLQSEAAAVVVSIIPFTRALGTESPEAAAALAEAFARLARAANKPLALAVDAGPDYTPYRQALATSGLPVFTRVEEAIGGLRVLG
ncbi:MAG TPA: CoA-binding protein [Holophagaceae bacterium]|nr:CoA-binding protein [Holophagaceae bacterium]